MSEYPIVTEIPKPADCGYRPDRGWRFEPEIAENRKAVADLYRAMRQDGKGGLARLQYVVIRDGAKRIANGIAETVMRGRFDLGPPEHFR